jgi:hypothetical protein
MKKPIYLLFLGLSIISIGITFMFISLKEEEIIIRQEKNRIEFVKDSLDTEYNMKQLNSYPFEHSEIKDSTVKYDK